MSNQGEFDQLSRLRRMPRLSSEQCAIIAAAIEQYGRGLSSELKSLRDRYSELTAIEKKRAVRLVIEVTELREPFVYFRNQARADG